MSGSVLTSIAIISGILLELMAVLLPVLMVLGFSVDGPVRVGTGLLTGRCGSCTGLPSGPGLPNMENATGMLWYD